MGSAAGWNTDSGLDFNLAPATHPCSTVNPLLLLFPDSDISCNFGGSIGSLFGKLPSQPVQSKVTWPGLFPPLLYLHHQPTPCLITSVDESKVRCVVAKDTGRIAEARHPDHNTTP